MAEAERPPCTILIVGHGPGCLITLVGLLHRQGYTVVTVGNGALAREHLPVRQYEVILCNLDRPESDGHTFYALLQQHYPALCPRVIFLTDDTTEVLGAIARVLHTLDEPHAA